MLRVKTGHYRDSFRRRTFDVFRDKLIGGTHTEKGWRYQLYGGYWSKLYEKKEQAALAARCAINDELGAP